MPKPTQIIAYLSLIIALLALLHQYLAYGVWFEIKDIHHETIIIAFLTFSLGIFLGMADKTGKP